jgi:Family of unknown function (DUF6600)
MKKRSQSIGKATLLGALMISLTGCVTKTVYVTQNAPAPEQPAPEPEPAPVPPPQPAPVAYDDTMVIRSETDFYEPLSPYGQWVVIAGYGRCWRPARVDATWRPYSNGHWIRTEAGWYWASSEPWGWATYHYGRWDWMQAYGWIWVPQIQWAPAWVTWREGGGYVGWAPMPPHARITVSGSVEVHETVIAPRFVFVEERHMTEPVHPRTVIVNNQTVVNKTVNITKIQVVNNNTVINEGPRTEIIEHASGKKVTTTPVHEVRHDEEVVARKHEPPAWGRRGLAPGQNKSNGNPHNDTPGQTPTDTVKAKPGDQNKNPNTQVVTKPTPPVTEKTTHDNKQVSRSTGKQSPRNERPSQPQEKPAVPVAAKTEPTASVTTTTTITTAPAPTAPPQQTQQVETPAKPAKEQTKEQHGVLPVQAREVHSNEKNTTYQNESAPARPQVSSPKEHSNNGHGQQNSSNSNSNSNSQKEQKKKKSESGDNTDKQ